MDLKETYNKIADEWVTDHFADTWWQEGTDYLISLLPKHATILDVGCGGGHKTKYFQEKSLDVLGIDFSENMITRAKKEVPEAKFQVLDAYEVDKLPQQFDCVFAQAMLLHVPKKDVLTLLKKFKDRLNKNGLLYIAVKEIKEDQTEEKVVKENDYGYEYERFFSFFTLSELHSYFKKIGLEVEWENKTTSGKAVWLQIIGKKI